MKNKRILMIVAGLLGVTAVCCVVVLLFIYFTDGFGEEDTPEVTYSLTALKAACSGEGVPEAAVFNPDKSGVHPAAIAQQKEDGSYSFPTLDWGFQPAILERAELVICLDNVVETVTETCEYTLEEGAGSSSITRISLVADYRLIVAQSGKLLDEGQVKATPRQCKDEEIFANNADFSVRGDFGEAIRPFVEEYVSVP
ncbi:MAG: hypothetical protein GY805_29620 [Chloroflexi bacterium]|nr:hypothetical protein [Chloroflexota bacterium]